MRILITAALLAGTMGAAASAQDSIPIYPNLGDYSRKVSTASDKAQLYFDQGIRLTYGYGRREGMRSFRHAAALDSKCALCWWGVAWAYGPYINGGMDSASGVAAYDAVRKAVAAKAAANEIERALIDAMATRYVAVPTSANRARLDSAYANAMRAVYRRYPTDAEVATLFGEALMVLRPWDQWTRTGDPQPGTPELLTVLEAALQRDIRHPGVCHQYIHAVEASNNPERAEKCADLLGARIPGASHIPHMPSHIYMRIGRYGDGVRVNQQAYLADLRAAHGGAPGIYTAHNLDMLTFAAAFDGQSAISMQAARDLAKISSANAYAPYVALARFGRWDELLEMRARPEQNFTRGVWHMGRGLAQLAKSQMDSATADLNALERIYAQTPDSMRMGSHRHKDLLGIAVGILKGEVLAAQKNYNAAVAALEAALPLEDSLTYDEPEPWILPIRHVLGAILLEADRPADAERRYREELRKHPDNIWSMEGLIVALREQGKTEEADRLFPRFKEQVARADMWLTGSRFQPAPAQPTKAAGMHH